MDGAGGGGNADPKPNSPSEQSPLNVAALILEKQSSGSFKRPASPRPAQPTAGTGAISALGSAEAFSSTSPRFSDAAPINQVTQDLIDSNGSLSGSEVPVHDAPNAAPSPSKKMGLVRTTAIRNLKDDSSTSPSNSQKNLGETPGAPTPPSPTVPPAAHAAAPMRSSGDHDADMQARKPSVGTTADTASPTPSGKGLVFDKAAMEERKKAFQNRHPNMTASQDGKKKSTQFHNAAGAGHDIPEFLAKNPGAVEELNSVDNQGWSPLHCAASGGYLNTVLQLLDAGAQICFSTSGAGPLYYVAATQVKEEDSEKFKIVVSRLLAAGDDLAKATEAGETPLHQACVKGSPTGVKILLSLGAPSAIKAKNGFTPFQYAVQLGRVDILRALIEANTVSPTEVVTSLHAVKEKKIEPLIAVLTEARSRMYLHHAIRANDQHKFESVLSAFKEQVANLQDDEGQRPLHTASAEGRIIMVEQLIANGAKINSPDKQLWTPLHYACKEGHLKVAKVLLDNNAELCASDNGTTPLHYFARIDPTTHETPLYEAVLDGMVRRKPDSINAQTSSGETALHQACMRAKAAESVKQLLQRGANPNLATTKKQTPLHYAILQYNVPVVTLLLAQELDLPLLNSCIELAEKTSQRDQRAMQLQLIQRYCELDLTRKDADGPAERKGSESQKGSNVGWMDVLHISDKDVKDQKDQKEKAQQAEREWLPPIATPTYASLAQLIRTGNHVGVFKAVLRHREAALALMDDDGTSPLHLAATEGNLEITRFLISQGFDVQKPDKDKWTPLHHSLYGGHLAVAKALLGAGATVSQNVDGATPLYYLARVPVYTENVELFQSVLASLLSQGEDINAQMGSNRETPLHQACMRSTPECVRILLKNSAKTSVYTKKNQGPLHYAAQSGKAQVVKVLFEHATVAQKDVDESIDQAQMQALGDVLNILMTWRCQHMHADEEKRLIAELKKGNDFKKINKKGMESKVRLRISDDEFYLLHGKKKVLFSDIEEIRFGQNTDGFARNQKNVSASESVSFSVIFWGQASLDVIAPSAADFILWTLGLKKLVESDNEQHYEMHEQLLRRAWVQQVADEEKRIRHRDVINVLARLNLVATPAMLKEQIKALETKPEEDEKLSFKELTLIVQDDRYAKDKRQLQARELQDFLHGEQDEESATLAYCDGVIQKFHKGTDDFSSGLTLAEFSTYLRSDENSLLDPAKGKLHQDMRLPLTDYYVASSHNTYLTGHQLTGESSVERYVQDLKLGCRCVELDIWDGPDGEPIIYHGHTLTTKILFSSVVKALRDYAFYSSPYPVILSFENHCSNKQQQRMAEHLRKILGNKLALPMAENSRIPSPVDLIEKILIKGGTLRGGVQSDVLLTEEAEDPEDQSKDAQKAAAVKAKNNEKRESVAQELSDITFLAARRMPNFERGWEPKQPYPLNECISFNEGRLIRISRLNPDKMIELAKELMTRSYPKAARVDSSNYNPVPFWNVGISLVALNYQTAGPPMWINHGKFLVNGQCGYVLKPEHMRSSKKAAPGQILVPEPSKLKRFKITVISAQQLPKPKLKGKEGESKEVSHDQVIDPYVVVSVQGSEVDTKEVKTKVIKSNGFNPLWNEEFDFSLKDSAQAMLLLSVMHNQDCVAFYSLPVEGMRFGYRSCRLFDKYGKPLPGSTLFCKILLYKSV